MADDIDVVGVGWKFPFEIDPSFGGVAKADGVLKVGMAIQQIMGTAIGERAWLRAFGTQALDLLFEPIDPSLQTLLEHYLVDAIERWEKRARVTEAIVDIGEKDDARVITDINFQLIKTQRAGNVVFPLYLPLDERERRGQVTG